MVPRLQLAAFSTLRRNNAQAVEKAANCRRGTIRGFTILEVLIVVAIIGIIAAVAMANYLNALQKTKQKRTMADIKSLATAWESRSVDTKGYNLAAGFTMPASAITYDQMTTLLAPTYMR